MEIDLLTKEDLARFKTELIAEIRVLLKADKTSPKQLLKSAEVIELLKCSSGTLQNLRINGNLPFRKVGGTMFYSREKIEKMMEGK